MVLSGWGDRDVSKLAGVYVAGITAGALIPNAAEWGLDFAMSVTFIGMVIPYLKSRPMVVAVVTAGLVSIVANPLPHKLGLIVAAIRRHYCGCVYRAAAA